MIENNQTKYQIKRSFKYSVKNLHLSFKRTLILLEYIRNIPLATAVEHLQKIGKNGLRVGTNTKHPEKSLKLLYSILLNLNKGSNLKDKEFIYLGSSYITLGPRYKYGIIYRARGSAQSKDKRSVHLTLPVYILNERQGS